MEEQFPKLIYVTRESDGDETYLGVKTKAQRPEDALTETTNTRVATYQLVEVKEGRLEPVFNTIIG